MQTDNKRMALQINGKTATGVKDVNGNLLDGNRNRRPGGNAVQFFKVFSGTTVRYTDRDGDRAEINIAQGGHIDGVRPLGGPTTQLTQFWIVDPIALRSTLSGTVQKAPKGDGIVVIAEIIGLDKKEFTPLLTNTSFRVNTLTFSSNATGIGATKLRLDLNMFAERWVPGARFPFVCGKAFRAQCVEQKVERDIRGIARWLRGNCKRESL